MSSTSLKARRLTATSNNNNNDNNSDKNDNSNNNNNKYHDKKKRIMQSSATPSKTMKVKKDNRNKSGFRCTPVKILLCFLCGWISLGTLGVLLYAKQHTAEVQTMINTNFPGYHFSFRKEPLRKQLMNVQRSLKREREKRLSLFKNAKMLLSAEQAKVLKLKNQLKTAGVAILGGGDDDDGADSDKSVDNQINQFFTLVKQQSVSQINDVIDTAEEEKMDQTLYNLHNSMSENDMSFFLFGPTLQRYLGGQIPLEAGGGSGIAKYVRGLHIGVWFHDSYNTINKLKSIFENIGYVMPSGKRNAAPGMPGDLIFVEKKRKRHQILTPVYVSPFYRGQTFVWHGGKTGPKVSYNNFLTTATEASLLNNDDEQTTLFIPTNPQEIFKEQRGDTLAFGGHNQRISSPTMSQPANLLVSCLDSAPYDGYNDYDDEGDDVKTGKEDGVSSVKTSDGNSDGGKIEGKNNGKSNSENSEIKKKKQGSKTSKNSQQYIKPTKDVIEIVDGNKFVFHKTIATDSVSSVINKYHISEADFRTWNELTGDMKVGEEYIVQLSLHGKAKSGEGNRRRRRLLRSDDELLGIVRRFSKSSVSKRQEIWKTEILKLSKSDQERILGLLENMPQEEADHSPAKPAKEKEKKSKVKTLKNVVKKIQKKKSQKQANSYKKRGNQGEEPAPKKEVKKVVSKKEAKMHVSEKEVKTVASNKEAEKPVTKKEAKKATPKNEATKTQSKQRKQSEIVKTNQVSNINNNNKKHQNDDGDLFNKDKINQILRKHKEEEELDKKRQTTMKEAEESKPKDTQKNSKYTEPKKKQSSQKEAEETLPHSSTVYVAKDGDTIETVSKNFGISANTLRALNGLDPNNKEDIIESGESYIISVPGVKPVAYSDNDDAPSSNLMNKHKQEDSTPTDSSKKQNEANQATSTSDNEDGKCENSCPYANDGSCDDGGEGAEYSSCELGTDCADCGVRKSKGGSSPSAAKAVAKGENQQQQQQQSRVADHVNNRPVNSEMPNTNDNAIGAHELTVPKQDAFVDDGKEDLLSDSWEDDAKQFDYIKDTDSDDDLIDKYCSNNCQYASDGICDDGGSGSKSQVCKYGSDCNDCGSRAPSKSGDAKASEKPKVEGGKKLYYPISTTKKLSNGDTSEVFLDNAFIYHTSKKSDTIETLAKLYNVNDNMLRHWNHLLTSEDIVEGTEYLVWRGDPSDQKVTTLNEETNDKSSSSGSSGTEKAADGSSSSLSNTKDNSKKSNTPTPLYIGGQFYADFEALKKGAFAPATLTSLNVGQKVFVRSGSSVHSNFWFRAHIIAQVTGKGKNGQETTMYKVEPVNDNDPNAKVHVGEKISREDIVVDEVAKTSELYDVIQNIGRKGSRQGHVIIFGRISGIVGGWDSILISPTNDGRFTAQTESLKGLKRNSLSPQFFRIYDNNGHARVGKGGSRSGGKEFAKFVRMASTQTLYLAEHVLRTKKIVFWLSGSTVSAWRQTCTIVPDTISKYGKHDVNLAVHFLDWERSVKKDLMRYGFELLLVNGAELKKETDDATMFQGLQYIFSRPVYCNSKQKTSLAHAKPETLAMCDGAGMTKYVNNFQVRLVIDVYHTKHNPKKETELFAGKFDDEGVLTGLVKEPLFELKWAEYLGRRFRIPL